MNNVFIPEKVRVGFNHREDTFSKKLGFVIPFEKNGKLRQEEAWKNWCDKKMGMQDIENIPQTNFILNKDIQRYHDFGRSAPKVRVHDPRGFEIEITLTNMLYILMHSDVSKRDIMAPCVYGWAGKDIALIPIDSEAYTNSLEKAKIKASKVSTKEFVEGHTYKSKDFGDVIYLGHYDTNKTEKNYYGQSSQRYRTKNLGKCHWFFLPSQNKFHHLSGNDLIEKISEEIPVNFANLVEKILKLPEINKVGQFKLVDGDPNYYYSNGQGYLFKIVPKYGKYVLECYSFYANETDSNPYILLSNYNSSAQYLGKKFEAVAKLFKNNQSANKSDIINALQKSGAKSLQFFDSTGTVKNFKILST